MSECDCKTEDGWEIRDVEIKSIVLESTTQPREELNKFAIHDYEQLYREEKRSGADVARRLKAITTFEDTKGKLHPADGFHRITAAKRVGFTKILAMVRPGTTRDAVFWSFGANAENGLTRSNEDKARAVSRMLEDDEWKLWPVRRIAEHCRVSDTYVRTLRCRLGLEPKTEIVVERNGKQSLRTATKAEPKVVTAETPVAVIDEPSPVREPQQSTRPAPLHEFRNQLKGRGVAFKSNVKTELGMIHFQTSDALYHVEDSLTVPTFQIAFTYILLQRQTIDPSLRAVIVCRHIFDAARPWIGRAKQFGVEVMMIG